jgi:hypothetical protein
MLTQQGGNAMLENLTPDLPLALAINVTSESIQDGRPT